MKFIGITSLAIAAHFLSPTVATKTSQSSSVKPKRCSTSFGLTPASTVVTTTVTLPANPKTSTQFTTITKTSYSSTKTVPEPSGFTPVISASTVSGAPKRPKRHPQTVYCTTTASISGPATTKTVTRTSTVSGKGVKTAYAACNPKNRISTFNGGHDIIAFHPNQVIPHGKAGYDSPEDCCSVAFSPKYDAQGWAWFLQSSGAPSCEIWENSDTFPSDTWYFFSGDADDGGIVVGNGPLGTAEFYGYTSFGGS